MPIVLPSMGGAKRVVGNIPSGGSTTPTVPTRVDSQERALGFKSAHPGGVR
jgi:hypothetical protein